MESDTHGVAYADECLLSIWQSGQIVFCPWVGPAVRDAVSAAGSKVESLFKMVRQAGVARIRTRAATVRHGYGTSIPNYVRRLCALGTPSLLLKFPK